MKYTLISFLILLLGGGIQCGLAIVKETITDSTMQSVASYVTSVIISVFNFILYKLMVYASHREKYLTRTEEYSAMMIKISFLQFLNAGVFLVFAKLVANV